MAIQLPHRFRRWGPWFLFLAACYFPVFWQLDSAPIRTWDESLFAMRAYYLAETGAYLPNFDQFPGISFYRNLKPPFGTCFQAASFRFFGVSELSLRLPVSLFVLATIFLQYFWLKQLTGHRWPGWAAGLILLTSAGYLAPHVARTGDHDAILAFLLLVQLWAGHGLLRAPANQPSSRLWLLAGALLTGFLTKSIVAFFFVPGLILFALYQGSLPAALRRPRVYLASAVVLGSVLGYYALMETLYPGFVGAVRETVLGRYVAERNQMGKPFYYYFAELIRQRFLPWVLLLPLLGWLRKYFTPALREWTVLSGGAVVFYLLIISFSKTKLAWYDAAVYPPLAMLGGVALFLFGEWMRSRWAQRYRLAILALWLLFFIPAYVYTIWRCAHFRLEGTEDRYAYLMDKAVRELPDLKAYTVYCHPFNGQVAFYTQWYNDRKGCNIRVATNFSEGDFQRGDYVLVCQEEKKEALRSAFQLTPVSGYFECQLYLLE